MEAVMSLMSPILGLSGAFPRFFSISLFTACIVLVAHNIVKLQSERAVFYMQRERVANEKVDKEYPQKTRHKLFVFRVVSRIKFGKFLDVVSGDAPKSRLGCTGNIFRDIINSLLESPTSIEN